MVLLILLIISKNFNQVALDNFSGQMIKITGLNLFSYSTTYQLLIIWNPGEEVDHLIGVPPVLDQTFPEPVHHPDQHQQPQGDKVKEDGGKEKEN